MAHVKIYTTTYCPFCIAAKRLLDDKNIKYEEVDLAGKPAELNALKQETGWPTVPQIFIGEQMIGGFDDLSALDESGELKKRAMHTP